MERTQEDKQTLKQRFRSKMNSFKQKRAKQSNEHKIAKKNLLSNKRRGYRNCESLMSAHDIQKILQFKEERLATLTLNS